MARRRSQGRARQAAVEAVAAVDVVLRGLDDPTRRIVWLLSASLYSTPTSLARLRTRVWGDGDHEHDPNVEVTLESVGSWSFVEETAEGWRLLPELAPLIARRFREEEPEAFYAAHALLAGDERETLATEVANAAEEHDPYAEWFSRSRLAFYLAATQPADAVEEFGIAFDTAPTADSTPARIWLSTLVLRQEDLLADFQRVLLFFEGYRAYVEGQRAIARGLFERVVATDATDQYQAIAQHLLAMCLPTGVQRVDLLRSSARLSHKLSVTQNEIMARNSLVTSLVALAQTDAQADNASAQRLIDEALSVAALNLELARTDGNKFFLAYALSAHALATWLSVAGLSGGEGRSVAAQKVAQQVLSDLAESVDAADQAQLPETALASLNQRASLLIDAGRHEAALDALAEAIGRIMPWTSHAWITRLGKSLGRLKRELPAELRAEFDEVDAALRTASSGRQHDH